MPAPSSPTVDVDAARAFVRGHARILDQRRAEAILDGASPEPVVHAVLAYRNADGGFGHGLEPDTRDPHSQPLYAQVALEAVASAGTRLPDDVATGLCDHLATVAGAEVALPIMLPTFARYPRATHWQDAESFPPDLNPTAALAGLLHHAGVQHPWVDDATEWCLARLEADGPTGSAHTILNALILLEHLPDRHQERASRIADDLFAALDAIPFYRADPTSPDYGLTPLDYARRPDSPWRTRFDDDLVAAHLDALAAEQQPDGGWPIRWEPPTEPSVWEWRGMVTVDALATLRAYDVTT